MFTSSRITRASGLALAVTALAAGPAAAHEPEVPIVRHAPAAVAAQRQDLRAPDRIGAQRRPAPPRTEGMGAQPARPPSARLDQPVSATPLTVPPDGGGIDWAAVVVGASGLLALGLGAAAIRAHRHARLPAGTPHA